MKEFFYCHYLYCTIYNSRFNSRILWGLF